MEEENIVTNNNVKKDEINTYIDMTWSDIKGEFDDIKSKKFEDDYLAYLKEKALQIAEFSPKIDVKLSVLEEYIAENMYK